MPDENEKLDELKKGVGEARKEFEELKSYVQEFLTVVYIEPDLDVEERDDHSVFPSDYIGREN
jgi:hypothetical protein